MLFGDDWPWSIAGAALNTGAVPTSIASGAQAIMKTPWWGQQSHVQGALDRGRPHHRHELRQHLRLRRGAHHPLEQAPGVQRHDGATKDDKIKWHTLAWINADYVADVPLTIGPDNDYGSANPASSERCGHRRERHGWGSIATGDTKISDVSPNLSHDGNSIVYVTTDYSPDGHPDATATVADIRTVPVQQSLWGYVSPAGWRVRPKSTRVLPVVLAR